MVANLLHLETVLYIIPILYYIILHIQEETLETWMKTIDLQPFAMAEEPLHLMNIVTSLVSRAQLIEWGKLTILYYMDKIG